MPGVIPLLSRVLKNIRSTKLSGTILVAAGARRAEHRMCSDNPDAEDLLVQSDIGGLPPVQRLNKSAGKPIWSLSAAKRPVIAVMWAMAGVNTRSVPM